jgi:FtsH-binding integral membrane protein
MTPSASPETDSIQTKQTQLLYQHVTIGLVATSVNALVFALVLWPRVGHLRLIGWFIACESTALLRYLLLLQYRKLEANNGGNHWEKWFFIGTVLSGTCWGAVAVLVFPTDSIPHQAFLAFVLGGLAAGAVPTYSVRMGVFLAFVLPALLPITIRFFLERDHLHLAMGGMGLLFIVLMVDSARRVHRTIERSLQLEFANQSLIRRLSTARDELERRVEDRTMELRKALSEVKILSGLLPICSNCKKIRDDQGSWSQMELYIHQHSEAEFTHSLCPECAKKLFPGFGDDSPP